MKARQAVFTLQPPVTCIWCCARASNTGIGLRVVAAFIPYPWQVMDEIQEELLAELEQRHTRHLAQIKADHDELLQRKIEVLCNEFASHDTAQSILAKVAHVRETDEPKPSSETLARRLSAGMRAHASQLVESEYARPSGVMRRGRFGVMRRGRFGCGRRDSLTTGTSPRSRRSSWRASRRWTASTARTRRLPSSSGGSSDCSAARNACRSLRAQEGQTALFAHRPVPTSWQRCSRRASCMSANMSSMCRGRSRWSKRRSSTS